MKNSELSEFLLNKLGDLNRKSRDTFTISFSEISSQASELPRSAYKHRAWWANHGSKPWLDAGFRTEAVDMKRQLVTFRRSRPSAGRSRTHEAHDKNPHSGFHDEAGAFRGEIESGDQKSRHPFVGILRGKIRIAADLDLTAPSDPDWGKVYDR